MPLLRDDACSDDLPLAEVWAHVQASGAAISSPAKGLRTDRRSQVHIWSEWFFRCFSARLSVNAGQERSMPASRATTMGVFTTRRTLAAIRSRRA